MVALRVLCLSSRSRARTNVLAHAMAKGIARAGDAAYISETWTGDTSFDVVVGYGWKYWLDAFEAMRAVGKSYVFLDGGYWGRTKESSAPGGYHKVTINGRHPVVDLSLPAGRFEEFGLELKPWRHGGEHILIAGMSAKNAADLRWPAEQWERHTIADLRKITNRPIVYRPKPTWKAARKIPGTRYSPPTQPLADVLRNCWAVVSHHSNVAIDGLIDGIPFYVEEGAARPFSMPTLDQIESPPQVENREAFLRGLAWWQWSLDEMERGLCWDFIRGQLLDGKTL